MCPVLQQSHTQETAPAESAGRASLLSQAAGASKALTGAEMEGCLGAELLGAAGSVLLCCLPSSGASSSLPTPERHSMAMGQAHSGYDDPCLASAHCIW